MKKLMTAVLLLLSAAVVAQDKNFESCPLDVIANNWKAKTIDKVANGSLGVMLECLGDIASSWEQYLQGKLLDKGGTFVVDTANGFMRFDRKYTGLDRKQMEMCYWNCSDGKHKLVAENIETYANGRQIDTECTGWQFFMYDINTHRMKPVGGDDLGFVYDFPQGNSNTVSIALPRQGKTVVLTCHTPSGKITKRLTWNGSRFVKE